MDSEHRVDAQGTPTVRAAWERALKELRQDVGCTRERLTGYPELLTALEHRVRQSGKHLSPDTCLAELADLVRSLGDPRHRDALLVALRFDPRFQQTSLTDRRAHYQDFLEKSDDPVNRAMFVTNLRTVERRENKGIHGIVEYLGRTQPAERGAVSPAPVDEQPARRIDSTPGVDTDSATFTYAFSDTGAMTRHDVVRWLRTSSPTSETALSWTVQYFADRRPGVLEAGASFGWHLESTEELEDGTVETAFQLPRPLRPSDGLYPVGYYVTVRSSARSSPVVYWQPTTHPSSIEFRLVFDQAMAPVRAWWFSSRSRAGGMRPPDPGDDRELELLHCAGTTYLYKRWPGNAAPYMCHGIAWIWD